MATLGGTTHLHYSSGTMHLLYSSGTLKIVILLCTNVVYSNLALPFYKAQLAQFVDVQTNQPISLNMFF